MISKQDYDVIRFVKENILHTETVLGTNNYYGVKVSNKLAFELATHYKNEWIVYRSISYKNSSADIESISRDEFLDHMKFIYLISDKRDIHD